MPLATHGEANLPKKVMPKKQDCFDRWEKEVEEEEKKKVIIEFMKEHIKPAKLDEFTLFTGLVTPPAAMAAKKAGQNIPQLKLLKFVPDVLFVPSVTILGLFSAKLSRRIFQK